MNEPSAAVAPGPSARLDRPHRIGVLHHWPALVGVVAVALILVGEADREVPALVVAIAALCYLAAAATDRPWVAWAAIPASAAVVTTTELLAVPWWWTLAGSVVVLVLVGLLHGAPRPALTAQTAAVLAFGALAAAALLVDQPRVGLAVAGAALASHAVWDAVHYRRRVVVPRSLAEACLFLDVPAGVGFVVIALVG
ncbi:hypothetical protein ATJ97_2357 [Georgenia soli]|uniref:Uncharacterized protein n=1 Tax=Georgenia soli TaxID=638953 RepID=A0A2A9ENP7_9MICO|nr:hypothetical protein [Georgenia soli]PFG39839.1 hypothetical protein ATJ97_2357 [Georgenia soli]